MLSLSGSQLTEHSDLCKHHCKPGELVHYDNIREYLCVLLVNNMRMVK